MDHAHQYIIASLELHLFFARIMKEHAFFMEAGFTPVNAALAKEADEIKEKFEELLLQVIRLSNGHVRPKVLRSEEIVTEFTARVELQTQRFTGIEINREITALETALTCGKGFNPRPDLVRRVRNINQAALRHLECLISLKESVIGSVAACRMFTVNYPLLIKHILREAKLYQSYILRLESGRPLHDRFLRQTEQFWNRIMMEHALFIRGLLDPTEEALIKASNNFANDFARLLETSRRKNDIAFSEQTEITLRKTIEFRDFKAAGTKGISNCEIQSIILPLLADHVLREANHYIRLLND